MELQGPTKSVAILQNALKLLTPHPKTVYSTCLSSFCLGVISAAPPISMTSAPTFGASASPVSGVALASQGFAVLL